MQNEVFKIAIPLAEGRLSLHFGHCDQFAIFELKDRKVLTESVFTPPEHAPGAYPNWLASQNVNEVLVGGIGAKAVALFEQHQIKVTNGVEADTTSALVEQYLTGKLATGANTCNHDEHEHHHCKHD